MRTSFTERRTTDVFAVQIFDNQPMLIAMETRAWLAELSDLSPVESIRPTTDSTEGLMISCTLRELRTTALSAWNAMSHLLMAERALLEYMPKLRKSSIAHLGDGKNRK